MHATSIQVGGGHTVATRRDGSIYLVSHGDASVPTLCREISRADAERIIAKGSSDWLLGSGVPGKSTRQVRLDRLAEALDRDAIS